VKTSVRKTKTGEVRYLQLAHNEWDAARGRSVPKVSYGFGRGDQLDTEAVRRLVTSLSRLLEPDSTPLAGDGGLEFAESRPYGGAYVLDRLWQRLGVGTTLAGLASPGPGRPRDAAAAERVLSGLVANRALAPSSKLAAFGADEPRRAHRRPRPGQRRRVLPGEPRRQVPAAQGRPAQCPRAAARIAGSAPLSSSCETRLAGAGNPVLRVAVGLRRNFSRLGG
jgi:hypothetical protein